MNNKICIQLYGSASYVHRLNLFDSVLVAFDICEILIILLPLNRYSKNTSIVIFRYYFPVLF